MSTTMPPQRIAPTASCVNCRKVLDATWPFCPACGADNRDPALHPGKPTSHQHNFSFGTYCCLCGAGSGSIAGGSTELIVLSDDLGLRLFGISFIAVSVFVIVYSSNRLVHSSSQSRDAVYLLAMALLFIAWA